MNEKHGQGPSRPRPPNRPWIALSYVGVVLVTAASLFATWWALGQRVLKIVVRDGLSG